MRPFVAVVATVLVVALAGCPKQGPRSPEYQQAQDEFTQLYGKYVEDAYLRPEMPPIEAKLEQVPETSSDYARAQELLKRIRSGRERVTAENESRRQAVAAATQPVQDFQFQKETGTPQPEAAPVDAGPADAGAPEHPVVGMKAWDIQRLWGDCFLPGPTLDVPGKGSRQTLTLRESAYCMQHHPGYDAQLVVMNDGVVSEFAPKKDMEIVPPDAGPTRLMVVGDDGGLIPAPVGPDGGILEPMQMPPAPSPADAG